MYLTELISDLNIISEKPKKDVDIKGIAYDSRCVQDGFLFVCIKGEKFDGHDFIPEAIKRGAKAVVVERDIPRFTDNSANTAIIKVADSRKALAILSLKFYRHPEDSMKLVGITGTNGKTTTSFLTLSLFQAVGLRSGLLGTIKNKIGDEFRTSTLTTMESLDLAKVLHQMRELKTEGVAMEVSSHALVLKRVSGLHFDRAIFTNLTQDHLDFHKTVRSYFQAKLRLFTELADLSPKEWWGIVNSDDEYGRKIIRECPRKIITYGRFPPAEVVAENIKVSSEHTEFRAQTPSGPIDIRLKLPGMFNLYNALAVIASGISFNFKLDLIKKGIEEVASVPGRLEKIDEGQDFMVLVDYAHTPDGLYNLLSCGRDLTSKRIILVFGCGGDRDKKKRPLMGKIAAKMADYTIITSDNPRTEEPMKIIHQIEKGFKEVGLSSKYELEVDRYQGIKKALKIAKKGDLVLIAGKGHETYQIFKDRTVDFDDREVVREILKDNVRFKTRRDN